MTLDGTFAENFVAADSLSCIDDMVDDLPRSSDMLELAIKLFYHILRLIQCVCNRLFYSANLISHRVEDISVSFTFLKSSFDQGRSCMFTIFVNTSMESIANSVRCTISQN